MKNINDEMMKWTITKLMLNNKQLFICMYVIYYIIFYNN